MQFKELVWQDTVSDGVLVCSACEIDLCGVIKMKFYVNHEREDNKYLLYIFGKGSLRRLQPEKYDSVEIAKNMAYKVYSREMARIKKAVDFLVEDDRY